jgi:hypothetical protein
MAAQTPGCEHQCGAGRTGPAIRPRLRLEAAATAGVPPLQPSPARPPVQLSSPLPTLRSAGWSSSRRLVVTAAKGGVLDATTITSSPTKE